LSPNCGRTLEREKVDLGDLVEQIASEAEATGRKKPRIHRAGDTPGTWDRGRLLRMIANLVNNGLAHGDPS